MNAGTTKQETMTGFPGFNQPSLPVGFEIPPKPISTLYAAYERRSGSLHKIPSIMYESGLNVFYLDMATYYSLSVECPSSIQAKWVGEGVLPLGISQHSFDVSPCEGDVFLFGTPFSLTMGQQLFEYTFQTPAATGYTASAIALNVPSPPWYSAVKNQLESLPTSDDLEVAPTADAYLRAEHLVMSAYASMVSEKVHGNVLATPVIGTDDSGGIMVSWSARDKYVAAHFGARPESRSFLYFEQGAKHGVVGLSEQSLLEKLKWLSQ